MKIRMTMAVVVGTDTVHADMTVLELPEEYNNPCAISLNQKQELERSLEEMVNIWNKKFPQD